MDKRILYLDNLRVFLISYVIVGHVSVAYGAIGQGHWGYIEPGAGIATKAALYLVDMLAYSYLMVMFIFIAGYFTPGSFQRKGIKAFLKDRLIRLFIPLAFYYFIVGPLVKYISQQAKGEAPGSVFDFFGRMYQSGVYGYTGVMWFVEMLLVFSVAYAAYRYFLPQGFRFFIHPAFPSNRSIFVFVLLLGLASFASRAVLPLGGGYMAARPLASIVLFGSSFFLGTIAWENQWLDKINARQAWYWFWIALAVMVVPAILFLLLRKSVGFATIKSAGSLASLLYSFWEVIKSVGTGLISLVLFSKYFSGQGRLARLMGRGTFSAYVLHPLVCMVLLYAMSGVGFHPLVKFAIVAPVSVVLTFAFAWVWLKLPGIKKVF